MEVGTAADEALLLDLLNTTPVVDGAPTDTLGDLTSAASWMRARGVPAVEPEWKALVAARSELQAIVRGERSPAALRPFVKSVALVPTAGDDGLDWRLTTPDDTTGAARAVLAWDALRVGSPGRLRPCANTECRLFLIDRSKPNTARWCSMAICGNRMKARRHYHRARPTRDLPQADRP